MVLLLLYWPPSDPPCNAIRLRWDGAPNGWQSLWNGGTTSVTGSMISVFPPCGNPTTGYTAIWSQSSPTANATLTIY